MPWPMLPPIEPSFVDIKVLITATSDLIFPNINIIKTEIRINTTFNFK